jgi:hypothetical protein
MGKWWGADVFGGATFVMAGLVPAIHVFFAQKGRRKTWMPGTSPGMTMERGTCN